jgi:glycosyltransferase involved in cell wall biosynthesis
MRRGVAPHDRRFPELLIVADGASIHTRRLLRALIERDMRVEIAAFESAEVDGLVEHRLGNLPPDRDRRYLLGVPTLARVIRSRHPAIVHAHYVSSYGIMTALALRFASGPKLVQTAWGTDLLVTARESRLRAGLAASALRAADLVTGDSIELERAAQRLAPGTPWMRFVFGPPAALLATEGPREPLMVSMRRLDPDMRVDLAVRAFLRAREAAPAALAGWTLLVAGDGSQADRVREAAAGDAAIELVGRLDHATLHARLGRARLQVSVPTTDTTSAALLDGLAAGLVPVVSDLEGPREWVDESIGEIVPRDPSVVDVAGAIVRAAARNVPPDRIRDRVRAVTWEREIERLMAAYRSLLPR